MDLKASLVDHVTLALDIMDMNNADDFELAEKENKQWFGSAVNSNDTSIACLCLFTLNVGTYVKTFHCTGSHLLGAP